MLDNGLSVQELVFYGSGGDGSEIVIPQPKPIMIEKEMQTDGSTVALTTAIPVAAKSVLVNKAPSSVSSPFPSILAAPKKAIKIP